MHQPPIRKYIKVWVEKRKNPPRKNGKRSTSYTLEWVEHGKRNFISLGTAATKGYADAMARRKEAELNNTTPEEALKPITWDDFKTKYLDTVYPGHDLPTHERQQKEQEWGKSVATMREERRALESFGKHIKPGWCHEITTEEREEFIQKRLKEVKSAGSVEKDLRLLRFLFNVMEEWRHRPKDNNPFSGNGSGCIAYIESWLPESAKLSRSLQRKLQESAVKSEGIT